MALQTSGAISISQIKAELGNSSNSLRTLSAAVGKSTPDSMSEFYGYSAYVPPIVIYGYSDQGAGASVGGNGYANDPYYFSEENPGPYQGQLMFWLTESGQTIQNLGFGGTYYSLTITYMDYWGYVIPLDSGGYLTNNYYYIDYTPITFSYMPGNSRGFVIGHQGDTPYTVNGSFYLSP